MNKILVMFLTTVVSLAQAQQKELNRLKGTWLITYLDTTSDGKIYQDTIETKLEWSVDGQTLIGVQYIKAATKVSYNHIRYFYDRKTHQFDYEENGNPPSPILINGSTWTYPAGDYRTLNIFNKTGTEIIYLIQHFQNDKWVTTKKGKELKIE